MKLKYKELVNAVIKKVRLLGGRYLMSTDQQSLYKNELELKYEVLDSKTFENCKRVIEEAGFKIRGSFLETDFVPDLANFGCKSKGIVLRYRIVKPRRYLLTLKLKGRRHDLQDNIEIEYESCSKDKKPFKEIQRIINSEFSIQLSELVLLKNTIIENTVEIIDYLYSIGFTKCRMLSQKKRTIYTKGEKSFCFDTFPDPIGTYLELEAFNDKDLRELKKVVASVIELDSCEVKNYGKIIQEKLNSYGIPRSKQRVCVFSNNLQNFVYQKFKL